MTDADRPPLVRLTWRAVLTFLLIDFLLTVGLVVLVVRAFAAPAAESNSPRGVLEAQVEAWNRGDLAAFMAGYWQSDDLTFFSGGQVTKGWQATFDRYRQKYQAGGKEMGQLVFSDLAVDLAGPNAAIVRGRWKLTFKDGTTPNGLFTLVMRRLDGQWRIVHDHTSAADKP